MSRDPPCVSVSVPSDWTPRDAEDHLPAVVVEGVEEYLYPVVGADAIAIGEGGVDGAMALEGANPEIDRRRRVPHEDFGGILGGAPVDGQVFGEPGERRGATPGGFVEGRVDRHPGVVEARDGDGGLAREAGITRAAEQREVEGDGRGERHVAQCSKRRVGQVRPLTRP